MRVRLAIALLALIAAGGTAAAETALDVLAEARMASGGDHWAAIAMIRQQGTTVLAGLTGRWARTEELRNGRFAETEDFGVYRESDVFDGEVRWKQDRSGGVHPLNAAFSQRNARTDSWLARRSYLKPGADGAELQASLRQEQDGRSFDVVRATPAEAEPVDLWFDAATHLLDRSVRQMPTRLNVTRLSDYRPVDGVMLPFKLEIGDEDGGDEKRITVDRYDFPAFDGASFRRPLPVQDTHLANKVRIPAQTGGYFVVDAMVNGRGPFGFIVDTGGHDILTPEAAKMLGLDPVGQGQSGGAGEGKISEQVVRVAKLQIGSATFDDQFFAVIPLGHGTVERDPGPPLAGIIGLELFERLAVRFDYRDHSLTLMPPAAVAACPGITVPIRFDDDMPLIEGTIEGAPGWIAIDTGNGGSTVVQGVWAGRNGIADRLKHGLETVSFGSGGVSHNWISRGHEMALGGAAISGTELRYAEDRKGAFSSRTEAANAGRFALANFTVTFDYAGGQMCLERSRGFRLPPFNRSGLGLSKSDPASFAVVQVRAGSPGAIAGLSEGDKILKVNGRDASGISYADVYDLIRAAPGTKIAFEVSHDGRTSQALVVLEEPKLAD